MVRPGRELGNDLKRFQHKFFNVRTGAPGKPGNSKKPGEASSPEPEQRPTAQELRTEQRAAMKPVSKGFVRISPKAPRLK